MAKENKGTLMHIWNLPYIFVFIKKWHPENFDTQKPTRKENIHYIYRFFLNKNQTKFKHKGGDFLVVRWSEIMHFNVSGFGKVQKQQQQKKKHGGNRKSVIHFWYGYGNVFFWVQKSEIFFRIVGIPETLFQLFTSKLYSTLLELLFHSKM